VINYIRDYLDSFLFVVLKTKTYLNPMCQSYHENKTGTVLGVKETWYKNEINDDNRREFTQ